MFYESFLMLGFTSGD